MLDMKQIRNNRGLTLVEIIVAIAILGMLVVGISGMLDLSVKQIFDSGNRTREAMVVQETADLLQAHNNSSTPSWQFASKVEIEAFLAPYASNPNYQISYQVGTEQTMGSGSELMKGWPVTISKTIPTSSKTVELSLFIVNHHYTVAP